MQAGNLNKDIPLEKHYSHLMSENEFAIIQKFVYESIGVNLTYDKSVMVASRLAKRLRHYNLQKYGDYFQKVAADALPGEKQIVVDLLTTNETSFFREPWHFDYLKEHVFPQFTREDAIKCWSAACSTGEEVYTLAMVLADYFAGGNWSIVGSDINASVLDRAQRGHYSIDASSNIDDALLKRYCLRGFGPSDGMFTFDSGLKKHLSFRSNNLALPYTGGMIYDIVFLRNVLIYFDREIKDAVVNNIILSIKPGGYLFIGHSEALKGFEDKLELVAHTAYRKRK